jgi:hypothetical protein
MRTWRTLLRRAVRSRPGRAAARSGDARDDRFAGYRTLSGPTLIDVPQVAHDPKRDADPRLVVLMPHLDAAKMTGGPNTVMHVAARAAAAGLPLRFVATMGPLAPDPAAVLAQIHTVTGIALDHSARFDDVSAKGSTLGVGAGDVLLATWWPTAHLAQAALRYVRAQGFLYLVQDYEPAFYAWSTRSALADATYRMPIRPIVNEPLLERYLRGVHAGVFADPGHPTITFMPAVDRAVFARHRRPAGDARRLVFYARPGKPRNLFEIGLRVLRQAAAEGLFDDEPWELIAVGQDLPELALSEHHVLRPRPWSAYPAYGELLGSSDVLLSLMLSPHTSYPPLEMAAAGGLVVTNTFGPKTREAVAAISPSIRAADPDVDSLLGTLREAVGEVRAGRPDGVDASGVSVPATWDEALRDVVPWITAQVSELRAG